MDYKLIIFDSLCSAQEFTINGVEADSDDFGDKYDHDQQGAEDYCCGDMHFYPKAPDPDILRKYKIDELEYWTIANDLESKLSFGNCGLCS